MTTQAPLQPAPLAKPGRLVLGIAAPVLGVWALVGLAVALRPQLLGGTDPAWMLAGFELINIVAAVLIGLLAMGRFREGPAITAAFAALAVAVGAMLGSVSSNNVIGETDLIPYMFARLILAAVIGMLALMLSIRSLSAGLKLVVGTALVMPIMAALGLFLLGRLGGVLSTFDSLHPAMSLVAAIIAGFAALVAVSAGGHLIIVAFEARSAGPAAGSKTPQPAPKKPTAANAE